MKKYPFVHQRENKDCGVACLSMIIKYYNGYIGEDTLYDMTSTSKQGTSAYHLIEAAKSVGFKADGIKCDIDNLKEIVFPCVAHVTLEQNMGHYIVIYNINWKKKELYIGDPARKRMKMKIDDFEKIFTGVVIRLVPEKPLPIYQNEITLVSYLKSLIKLYKKDWIKIWIESLICLLFSVLTSLSLAIMLEGIQINSKKWISYTIIIFVFLAIIKNLFTHVQEKIICKVEHKIKLHLMVQAIRNIIFLPYKFYCNRSAGEIVSRLQDLEKVGYELTEIMVLLCIDSTVSIVSGIILYDMNPAIWKVIVLWIIIYVAIVYIFRKIINDKVGILKQNSATMYNDLIETVKGFETIKGLQLEDNKTKEISRKYIEQNNKLFNLKMIESKQQKWQNIISDIGYIIVCGLCCIEVIKGNMQLSHVLIYQTLITYFLLPIEHILNMNTSICDMEKSLQRALEIIYHEDEKNKLNCQKIKNIKIKNLSYLHENKTLNNISFQIKSNEKIVLMGSSGSGKSTLLKILRGYYSIPNGKVYINDVDINSYTKESVGRRITYISQNEILFTDTIYNNIRLGRDCSENDIVNQIKINSIDDITHNKKIGLQDIIEEDGYNLSGGERQRIILARALLKDSDVILIDEGFSQMDNNLERNILKKIFKLYSKKIIIVVSHRKDNIDLFDTYIELKNGKIHTKLSKSTS